MIVKRLTGWRMISDSRRVRMRGRGMRQSAAGTGREQTALDQVVPGWDDDEKTDDCGCGSGSIP